MQFRLQMGQRELHWVEIVSAMLTLKPVPRPRSFKHSIKSQTRSNLNMLLKHWIQSLDSNIELSCCVLLPGCWWVGACRRDRYIRIFISECTPRGCVESCFHFPNRTRVRLAIRSRHHTPQYVLNFTTECGRLQLSPRLKWSSHSRDMCGYAMLEKGQKADDCRVRFSRFEFWNVMWLTKE